MEISEKNTSIFHDFFSSSESRKYGSAGFVYFIRVGTQAGPQPPLSGMEKRRCLKAPRATERGGWGGGPPRENWYCDVRTPAYAQSRRKNTHFRLTFTREHIPHTFDAIRNPSDPAMDRHPPKSMIFTNLRAPARLPTPPKPHKITKTQQKSTKVTQSQR